jgi:hypothetical protein
MGPFFDGLKEVLDQSLEHPNYFQNQKVDPQPYFDQDIYNHCLTSLQMDLVQYFSIDDKKRSNNLLKACQELNNVRSTIVPHHVMSAHDPPTIYDSTICIHPLASRPFTPLAFKLGVAKFYGWDPKPIGPNEKLLKMLPGDFEFTSCPNRKFPHEHVILRRKEADEVVSVIIAAMVEIAIQTGRTLVLPQYVRSDDAWAVPTHALVDVRSLGVPYRVMTTEESYRMRNDMKVVSASETLDATLKETLRYADTKVVALDRFCNVRDHESPVLVKRKKKMRWCLRKELKWSRAIGGWMDFCGASDFAFKHKE